MSLCFSESYFCGEHSSVLKMASVKYTRLPMRDAESGMAFDYSSAFTFEGRDNFQWKYKSPFSYGNTGAVSTLRTSEISKFQCLNIFGFSSFV